MQTTAPMRCWEQFNKVFWTEFKAGCNNAAKRMARTFADARV
jgi:hypothetical protein